MIDTAAAAAAETGAEPDNRAAVRRRFVAPARDVVDRECFTHPLFTGVAAFHDLLAAEAWPTVGELDQRLALPGKQLVVQDEALLADGQHYEQRIAQGRIPTRAENWHDLFNALMWARYPAIKRALNTRQCASIEANGPGQRDRAQAALTQFDETGVIVRVQDEGLMRAWDWHDWQALFVDAGVAWQDGRVAVAAVIGHALMEQALLPGWLLVGKCVVVQGCDDAHAVRQVAEAIARGDLLNDPLELRPLPLMGIPGWHAGQDAAFFAQTDYFRPLRDGRKYPSIQSAR